jgi:MMPL family/HhH-GPD superfamily base excision DNA repair protein
MVTEDPGREVWLRQARSYLRDADPVLARLIDDRPDFDLAEARLDNPFGLALPMDLFGALLFQITGQQLSVPATRRTLARIAALFGGHLPSATELLGADPAKLREAGLSWRKTGTLRDLAGRLSDGRLDPKMLSSLPDDEIMAELTAIPGMGPWTVHSALLLLGREDVVVYRNFPRTILVILATTYLLLLLMFRSVLLPLKAILMNTLSVGATYGALVYIFQSGNLGFPRVAFIDAIIPILLFCVLFGLSMDYEVFLLSRIREEWLQTKDNRAAVASGLEKTAGVITSAACLFVIITGEFTFASLVTTKEIGVGMTVAVLVDATFIRLLLVPATMRLLGRWNWWLPGRPMPPR